MSMHKYFRKEVSPQQSQACSCEAEKGVSALDFDGVSLVCSSLNTQTDYCDDLDEICDPPTAKRQALIPTPDCSEVASFVGINILSPESRYNLLVGNFKPDSEYSFPKNANGRMFQRRWLLTYPWLAYSKQEDGGFCLPCVAFYPSGYRGTSPGVLVSRPLTQFTKALELLRKHADKNYHKEAVVKSVEFLKVMTDQQLQIGNQLSQAMADIIYSNRQKIHSIMKTVELCGRQNIALRGHRDNATDVEDDISGSNHGNFRALLKFRINAGDTVLGEHLATFSKNATYTSSVIQNQIIDVLADQIRNKIIVKVQAAKWFTVIADEVTDVSNKEQLSFVLRYVDPDALLVREDLVGFL